MKKIAFGFTILTVILIAACTKYRDPGIKYPTPPPPAAGVIAFGCLRVNEFMCKGTEQNAIDTLGGATAKWFEIYNPTTADVELTAGKWYVTDTLITPTKFAIPTYTVGGVNTNYVIRAKGFLVIACPSSSTTPSSNHINASFSMKSSSGCIGIYYQATSSSAIIAIDTLSYNYGANGAQSGRSYGCKPDGQNMNWATPLTNVTCQGSND